MARKSVICLGNFKGFGVDIKFYLRKSIEIFLINIQQKILVRKITSLIFSSIFFVFLENGNFIRNKYKFILIIRAKTPKL